MSTYFAIWNPAAGGGRCGRKAPAALDRLRREGVELELVQTKRPRHASELASEAYAKGHRHFLSIGGDGTSFEILNGLPPASFSGADRATLALLPLGTGNSFLRDFTTDGAEYTLQAIRENRRRACDIIELKHSTGTLYFMNMLSTGFAADVGLTTNKHFKPLGEAGYAFGVLAQLAALRAKPFPMSWSGEELHEPVTFVSVANSRFTGGKMMMAPAADTSDGLADLVVLRGVGRCRLITAFPKIYSGSHVRMPEMEVRQVKELKFGVEKDGNILIDGDFFWIRPESLRVVPKAIEVQV